MNEIKKKYFYSTTPLKASNPDELKNIIKEVIANREIDMEIVFRSMFTRDFKEINMKSFKNLNITYLKDDSALNFSFLDSIFDSISKLKNKKLKKYREKKLFELLLKEADFYESSKKNIFQKIESLKIGINDVEKINLINNYSKIIKNNIITLNDKKLQWGIRLSIADYKQIMDEYKNLKIVPEETPVVFQPIMDIRSLFNADMISATNEQSIDVSGNESKFDIEQAPAESFFCTNTEIDILNYSTAEIEIAKSLIELKNSIIPCIYENSEVLLDLGSKFI